MQGSESQADALSFDTLAEIAVGSTARVELARICAPHPRAGTLVAVKRLHPHVADDPRFLDMFRDEVWLTASLRHAHVLAVEGWGEDRQGPWLAVEFVRGVSLLRLMKTVFETGEMFTERMVVYLARCVCDGLAAAHALRSAEGEPLGLVHRDITPGNILLGFDGQVKVADFGLAKAKQRLTRTLTGRLKGRPEYMSPEQVSGLPLDGRSDLFAFGVVLFELFGGRRPWSKFTGLDVMQAISGIEPEHLATLRPRIDPALVEVVDRCLHKAPDDRWPTAAALRDRLDAWLDGHGYRADNDRSLARFVRRNAMRQMRWFDRAVAGEFATEASALPHEPERSGSPTDRKVAAGGSEPPVPAVDWGEDGPTLVQPPEPLPGARRDPETLTVTRPERPASRPAPAAVDDSEDDANRTLRRHRPVPSRGPGSEPNAALPLGDVGVRMAEMFREARDTDDDTLGIIAPPDPEVPPVPRVDVDRDPETVTTRKVKRRRAQPSRRSAPASAPPPVPPRPRRSRPRPPLPVASRDATSRPPPSSPRAGVSAPASEVFDIAAEAKRLGEAARDAAAAAQLASTLAEQRAEAARIAAVAAHLAATGQHQAAIVTLQDAARVEASLELPPSSPAPSAPPMVPMTPRSSHRSLPNLAPGSGIHEARLHRRVPAVETAPALRSAVALAVQRPAVAWVVGALALTFMLALCLWLFWS
ncbi:MAG: serine/threonine-protein kinase [Myxococcota bacterium]